MWGGKQQDVETGWKTLQKIIKDTATEICGNKERQNSKPWFNDECKTISIKGSKDRKYNKI